MLNQSLICEVLVSCDPSILSPSGTGTMMNQYTQVLHIMSSGYL